MPKYTKTATATDYRSLSDFRYEIRRFLNFSEIAGWIAVFILRGLEVHPRGEISGFIVDERFRSQAVGKHLLAHAEQWVRDRGCEVVGLRSNVIRDRAHAFYLREGYQHTKTQKTFRKNLTAKS